MSENCILEIQHHLGTCKECCDNAEFWGNFEE